MKKCTKCKIEKGLGKFYKQKSYKDNLSSHCKECKREYLKQYYVIHKEGIRGKRKQYNLSHK